MKPEHRVCTTCAHNPSSSKMHPLGIVCNNKKGPVQTPRIFGVVVPMSVGKTDYYFECARSFCKAGRTATLRALRAANGEIPLLNDMTKRKDGSIQFRSEGKYRRVYPDGRLLVRTGTFTWEDMGHIKTKSHGEAE